jgi:hypothetical protein
LTQAAFERKQINGWAAASRCMTHQSHSRFISFWANRARMKRKKLLKTRSISWAKYRDKRNSCAKMSWNVSRRKSPKKSAVTRLPKWFCAINPNNNNSNHLPMQGRCGQDGRAPESGEMAHTPDEGLVFPFPLWRSGSIFPAWTKIRWPPCCRRSARCSN